MHEASAARASRVYPGTRAEGLLESDPLNNANILTITATNKLTIEHTNNFSNNISNTIPI